MGKASSSKKVARAARAAGKGAKSGQRRSVLFPATIALVCVLGVTLVAYARSTDEAEALSPGLTDHWHAAYGVYICDSFEAPFTNDADPNGIHTHGDGAIHIHPGAAQQVARAGDDATIGVFMNAAGADITDDTITLPDGTTYTEGEDQCDGEDAVVQVAKWANASDAGSTDPQVFTENLAAINFENDREAYTIAFLPEGAEIPPPETVDQLDELAGIDGGNTVTTPSTIPSTTTAPEAGGRTSDSTTTTAPPAG